MAGTFHNDVASHIITAGIGRPRQVFGTADITAHTDSGILAALAPTDIIAFDQIIAEIYTGALPPPPSRITPRDRGPLP
ncbi:hypothetical protein [Gordonia sp. OPL2]|uniref:hypothetical protein n=1 Tax=Gordonia sp. OPL2 TaxID=2486274 RepID=UPI0016561F23|nr:hypothetical protein [Gordonia sp. OPL2]ROZ88103.1 hypothetical protein EEB19_22470 [Gordonia sp. OPL2]